jgi:hypothetical protein
MFFKAVIGYEWDSFTKYLVYLQNKGERHRYLQNKGERHRCETKTVLKLWPPVTGYPPVRSSKIVAVPRMGFVSASAKLN